VSAAATRHSPYRLDNEDRGTVNMLGYGAAGTGEEGYTVPSNNVRRLVENRLETDAATLKATLCDRMGWDPVPGEQLVADFDNGLAANDALGATHHPIRPRARRDRGPYRARG
jgi:hypothetical protein